jgi:Putative transposase
LLLLTFISQSCGVFNKALNPNICNCLPLEPDVLDYRHAAKHVPLPSGTPQEIDVNTILGWAQTPLITARTVTFWYKDKKLNRKVEVQCSKEEFVERWAQHIVEHYEHSVRSFGLFAPQAINQTTDAIFAVFGQQRRARPKPLSWDWLIKHTFKKDPLLDRTGNRMKWVRRLSPKPIR